MRTFAFGRMGLLLLALFLMLGRPLPAGAEETKEAGESSLLKLETETGSDSLFSEGLGLKLVGEEVYKARLKSTQTFISKVTGEADKFIKRNVRAAYKSYLIPGLNQAVTKDAAGKIALCTGMVPQGLCFAYGGDYCLISAYCNCGFKHNSVIYVMDGKDKKLLTTLILDSSCHVGGIAAAGDYLWVCDSEKKALRAYKKSHITPVADKDYRYIRAAAVQETDVIPSFMCSANGYLYVGTFTSSALANSISYYRVEEKEIKKAGRIIVEDVSCIQGISIRDDYMILTSSHGRNFSSQICIYKDEDGHFSEDEKTYKSQDIRRIIYMPNMIEQCYIGSTYTYFLFESGARSYRNSLLIRPFDKFIRFKNKRLGIKK